MSIDEQLAAAAKPVDDALDASDEQMLEEGLRSLEALRAEAGTPQQRGLAHYFSANAIAGLRQLKSEGDQWWDQPLLRREILELRLALGELAKGEDGEARRLQILTNWS